MNIITLFLVYLTVVNIVTFITYGVDKWQATREGWRISEATLLWLVVAGGGFGALAAVWLFRHKTKHTRFRILVPLNMILQLALLVLLVYLSFIK